VQTRTVEPGPNYAAIDTEIKVAGPRAVAYEALNKFTYLIKFSLVYETGVVK